MLKATLNGVWVWSEQWREAQYRFWAGAAFVVLAMVSIQYEEVIAPSVNRVTDAWGGVTEDVRTKLAGFTL